jgi:phosphoribosylformylglycinamidine synthase
MAKLQVADDASPFTSAWSIGQSVRMPVAHGEGCYQCDDETLAMLEADGRVALRYAADDEVNGSRHRIAGITNEFGNVLGLMPHPERAVTSWMESTDGLAMFEAMASYVRGGNAKPFSRFQPAEVSNVVYA